jgi:tetratricopeptide (TPR) repeat protein
VNYRCLRSLWALAAVVLVCAPGRSQQPVVSLLRGEIHSDLVLYEGYVIDLYDELNHRETDHTVIHPDGAFEFRHVPYGNYEIRVTNRAGKLVQRYFVAVHSSTPPVEIWLPADKVERPPVGAVSLTQLKHPPTRRAFASFVAAQKFSEAGQYEKAARELERAIQISPEYAEAYTNLAVQNFRLGRYQDAVDYAKRAMELSRPNASDLCNMALALFRLNRFAEAVASARTAVRIDPANDKARYLLGSLLVMDAGTIREGIAHLERAVDTVPAAQVNLDRAKKALANQ